MQRWDGTVWRDMTGSTDTQTAALTVKVAGSGGSSTPPVPGSTTGTPSPQTGDSSSMGLWLAFLIISLAALDTGVVLLVWQRRRRTE